jgi:NAD(P)-dependent dehydrogenase (short-subunit alcohol dehydrogenase family)
MNVLITGGTSGLGKATVELLAAERDDHVCFTYLDIDEYRQVAHALEQQYPNVSGYPLDFCNLQDVKTFCVEVANMELDVLINSTYVGTAQGTYFHKTPVEDFEKAFRNNLMPTILITQAALGVFKKQRFGKIINIITEAVMGLPPMGYSVYAANKAYLMELSDVWNKEYTRYNITSNCILPAYMQTGFAKVDPRIEEQMIVQHPLKRLLTVNEVASVVKFLIEAPQQLNGVKLPVNAGQIVI